MSYIIINDTGYQHFLMSHNTDFQDLQVQAEVAIFCPDIIYNVRTYAWLQQMELFGQWNGWYNMLSISFMKTFTVDNDMQLLYLLLVFFWLVMT